MQRAIAIVAAFALIGIGTISMTKGQAQPTPTPNPIVELQKWVKALEDKFAAMPTTPAQFKIQSVSRGHCISWQDNAQPTFALSCDHAEQVWRLVPQ